MSLYLGEDKIEGVRVDGGVKNGVSYNPQTPTMSEQKQARDNIDTFGKKDIAEAIDQIYHSMVIRVKSVDEVNNIFVSWWKSRWTENTTKQSMVEEWFGKVLYDDRVHGVKLPLFSTSTSYKGELTDDSAGLVCETSTASKAGRDDFAFLPQFWTLEVAALKNEDGTHEFVAVEHIDPIEEVRNSSQKALTWVLQKNTYRGEGIEDGYYWLKTRCTPVAGYYTWSGGTDKNGRVYSYMGYPKYGCGVYDDGSFGCASGLKPALWNTQVNSVIQWRKRGTQYAGATSNILKWQMDMIELKYAVKGNSYTISGCGYYYDSVPAAVSEKGVTRILLAEGQGDYFLIGSTVNIDNAKNERSNSSPVVLKNIAKKETVVIGDVSYDAIYLDMGGATFDTVAGTSHITTMPYFSGYNDDVQGYDGSKTAPTSGKEPGLIQRTEFMNGAYTIVADELWKWGTNEAGDYTLDVYICNDASKITTNGSISGDYVKQEGLTMTFPSTQVAEWQYIENLALSKSGKVVWPSKISKSASSSTGVTDGFYLGPSTNAVRAAWRCGCLDYGGAAGLACGRSDGSVWRSYWGAAPGSSGLTG